MAVASATRWEFERPEARHEIHFGGTVEALGGNHADETSIRYVWHPAETIDAIAYDTPVPGWRGKHVNTLRLWSARAPDPLRLDAFNQGDHVGASSARARANAISQVLYPSEHTPAGQELRLRQEYFFSAASLADLVGRHIEQYGDVRSLAEYASVQLNDTHPAIAVAELMRLLVDEHALPWPEAWQITQARILLHQPHAAAGGAGDLAGPAHGTPAAAPHADHLSHQLAPSGPISRPTRGRTRRWSRRCR